jgi:hypothetical protein
LLGLVTPLALAQPPATIPAGSDARSDASAVASDRRPASEFVPSVHGFAFVNSFTGSPLPASLRRLEGSLGKALRDGIELAGAPNQFGLCGGMSLAAADLFVARIEPPPTTTPPKPGTALYEWVHQRQESSLGDGGLLALKFMQWMLLPDGRNPLDPPPPPGDATPSERTIAHETFDELGPILTRLSRDELVPLGLVYVRAAGNTRAPRSQPGLPWDNHQVLAYKASWHENPAELAKPEIAREKKLDMPPAATPKDAASLRSGRVTLWIYDPNYPDNDRVRIDVDVVVDEAVEAAEAGEADEAAPPRGTARCVQVIRDEPRRARAVRGMMLMPWKPSPIPGDVTTPSK